MPRPRIMLVVLALTLPVTVRAARTNWYVTTAATPDPNAQKRITLDAQGRTVDAGSGWACTISPPTAFGGRTTTCRKAREVVEFSVQCSAPRNEDHVQLRFRDAAGSRTFIEVGCRAGA